MATSWTGPLFVIPQQDGSHLVGITLPSGKWEEGSCQVFDGIGPLPPTGFPKMDRVADLNGWLSKKQAEGFMFKASTLDQLANDAGNGIGEERTPAKAQPRVQDVQSNWVIVIPMVQLRVSDEAPIGGSWQVGDVSFMSRRAIEEYLRPPNIHAVLPSEHAEQVLHETQAFAVVQRTGTPNDLWKTVFREVREAKDILAATDAFYGARHLNSGFNLQGYPIVTARSAWFVDQKSPNLFGNWGQEGSLQPWHLNSNWHTNITQTGITELFSALADPALEDSWRRQMRRAAACIGRSLSSLERSDAFLQDVFALETMLTRPNERNGRVLSKRIKGMTGWCLKQHRPHYLDEINDIFEARCDAVHDADYGSLTTEHLLLADLYAKNTLLNIVSNRAKFPTKKAMIDVLDGWADHENWPEDGSYCLRWVGNATFAPKALELAFW